MSFEFRQFVTSVLSSTWQIVTRSQARRNHDLLVNCLNALDQDATIGAFPTVTMAERVKVVLADDRSNGKIYPAVLSGILWLQEGGGINEDYTMHRGHVADLLTRTHPDAPVIYPDDE